MRNDLLEELEKSPEHLQCVVIVGLPGTGKSLLLRDAARFAVEKGRRVHLLQWDVVRICWDTPDVLARFPEVDGVTHAGIRYASGLWVRTAVADWFRKCAAEGDLLIVEAPIVGHRFAELAKKLNDELEEYIAGQKTRFVVVAPTVPLQSALRQRRALEGDARQHELEKHNASVAVLDMQIAAIERVAPTLGISPQSPGAYDPDLFVSVMRTILKHRNVMVLRPDKIINTCGSVYDLEQGIVRIQATPQDVADTIARAVILTPDRLSQEVELGWAVT